MYFFNYFFKLASPRMSDICFKNFLVFYWIHSSLHQRLQHKPILWYFHCVISMKTSHTPVYWRFLIKLQTEKTPFWWCSAIFLSASVALLAAVTLLFSAGDPCWLQECDLNSIYEALNCVLPGFPNSYWNSSYNPKRSIEVQGFDPKTIVLSSPKPEASDAYSVE